MSMPSEKKTRSFVAILLAIGLTACQTVSQNTSQQPSNLQTPTIDASPVESGEAQWKIAKAETMTLTVNAPSATSVRIFYRPIVATDRYVVLKRINTPTDSRAGKFSTDLKLVPDFAGEVWAEVSYPDGSKKVTEPIQLATQSSTVAQVGPGEATTRYLPAARSSEWRFSPVSLTSKSRLTSLHFI